ncbi:hypothetical protein SAMN02745166_01052 [Prosthecobacter debontii]|uniref:Uncharacterized protein n=1 Tax=Prosthecobacter debontii TaxID=48467 RepID=A0A1T4X6J8_9BACT|nr:hypothetical protein [Prosthecobacter debontii]SKA84728.1 hypothetical protein SAMN02745166_01052 [Prosthecobacter debontii]
MKKIIITLTDTPTAEDPHQVTVMAEVEPQPSPDDHMTPAMCLGAAVLEFMEAHAQQDKQDVLHELAQQMPEGIPPHLKG